MTNTAFHQIFLDRMVQAKQALNDAQGRQAQATVAMAKHQADLQQTTKAMKGARKAFDKAKNTAGEGNALVALQVAERHFHELQAGPTPQPFQENIGNLLMELEDATRHVAQQLVHDAAQNPPPEVMAWLVKMFAAFQLSSRNGQSWTGFLNSLPMPAMPSHTEMLELRRVFLAEHGIE